MTTTTTNNHPEKRSRAEQARINGAKSKGPTTPEGKAKSSLNALKHGFAAQVNVLLAIEDSAEWHAHLAGYRASFLPTNLFENDMVDQLASISWRKSRLVGLETALIDFQLSIQNSEVERRYPASAEDPNFHLVLAWQALARKSFTEEVENPAEPPQNLDVFSIDLVRRYQMSLDRQFRNAMVNLRQYRKDMAVAATPTQPAHNQPEPNEPKPQQPEPEPASTNPPTFSYTDKNYRPTAGSVPACASNSRDLPLSKEVTSKQ